VQTQQTYKPDESADINRACRETRVRVITLVRGLPEDSLDTPVPACPGWSVRDVVAHLAANAEDMMSGSMSGGPPSPEQTAAQIERMRGRSMTEMLAGWETNAEQLEDEVSANGMRMPLIDLTSHEHDIRGALARPGARDTAAVKICSQFLLERMRPPVPVRIVVEDTEFRVGPASDAQGDAGAAELVLNTSWFDALRWRMGRRSPAQLAAMQWSADPTPVLNHLFVFGPAKADVIE
jgi:uncharacterized protein (TIGR03083 family)